MIGYDGDYHWIPSKSLIQTRHRCNVLPGKCLYFTDKPWNLPRHEKTCTDQTKIKTKQVWTIQFPNKIFKVSISRYIIQQSYGPPDCTLDIAIEQDLLSEEFRSWRQPFFSVFDIETEEHAPSCDLIQGLDIHANLNFLSVACSTNLPDIEDMFIMKESSEPSCAHHAVKKFLDLLFDWEKVFYGNIPEEIHNALDELSDIDDGKFSKQRTKKQKLKTCLQNLVTMPCFGYNSGS